MKKLIAMACIALSGCASQPRAPISEYSSARLCEIAVRGNFWVSESEAMGELSRRNENCSSHMALINAKRSQEAQSIDLLRQAQPQMQPMPAPTRCISQNVGGNIITRCN